MRPREEKTLKYGQLEGKKNKENEKMSSKTRNKDQKKETKYERKLKKKEDRRKEGLGLGQIKDSGDTGVV